MKTCKVCTAKYRTGRIAYIMAPNGGLQSAVICQTCAKGGTLIVAAKPVATGVAEVLKTLRAKVKKLQSTPGSPPATNYMDGESMGLAYAIAVLEGKLLP